MVRPGIDDLQAELASSWPTIPWSRVRAKRLEAEPWFGSENFDDLRLGLIGVNVLDFVRINSKFGHEMGDAICAQLGDAIDATYPARPIIRFAFDRYAVILDEVRAADVAQLRARLEEQFAARLSETGAALVVGGLELKVDYAWSRIVHLALLVSEVDRMLTLGLGSPEPLVRHIALEQWPAGRPRFWSGPSMTELQPSYQLADRPGSGP